LSSSNITLGNKAFPDLPDGKVMLALQKGRKPALDELMRRYKKPLFNFIMRYTKDEDISYDILQETFFRVYNKAETYNPAYKFKTWLYQIALNLCRDYSRKKKLKYLVSIDTWLGGEEYESASLHEILASDENIENLTEHRQMLKLLESQIDLLPHKLKTALILFALENNSQEECARILGITPKSVEMRVYRARKTLLQRISKKI